MKVIIYGASGMVGQGVVRECLAAADVEEVLCVGRSPLGQAHPGLRELVQADLYRYDDAVADRLVGYDACFFCLGVSVAGLDEAAYTRITHDLTLAAAEALAPRNPQMVFTYVSGASTDSSERGKVMWARVKGRTENDLLKLPFKAAYMFRPGAIRALDGIKSKTPAYRLAYVFVGPLLAPLQKLFPTRIVTTREIGLAMLEVARHGADRVILEPPDIHALARLAVTSAP